MRQGMGSISSALLCLQLLAITTTVYSQLRIGDPGVCSVPRTVTKSRSESFILAGQIGYRIAYEVDSVSVLRCCTGYDANFTAVGDSCIPVCNPPCQNGGVCVSPFYCRCPTGWLGRDCSMDFNECFTFPCGFSRDVFCKNTPGSYECGCRVPGHIYRGRACHDIDECAENTHMCTHNCTNTRGSYRCTCLPGYSLKDDRRTCEDINECLDDNGGCEHICHNTLGSYHCTCPPGSELNDDGKGCNVTNLCLSKATNNCSQLCNGYPGGFICSCMDGYKLDPDGSNCSDHDECLYKATDCEQLCENTVGSFECNCRQGFTLQPDGKSCEDNDECVQNDHGCEHICNNTYGSYVCSCKEHHFLTTDGKNCQEITCLNLPPPDNGAISCTSASLNVGTTCDFQCEPGYSLQGSSSLTCQPNGVWSMPPPTCVVQQCDDLRVDHLGVVQPCQPQFNRSCTFVCDDGYYLDDHGNISTSILCALNDMLTDVQWNVMPVCKEGNACGSSPCNHGGICSSDDRESYECNCFGTGYTGDSCQYGTIHLPEIPSLNLSVPFTFTVEVSRPDENLDISFVSPQDLNVQPSKVSVLHDGYQRLHSITLTPNKVGTFQLSITLEGTNRNAFINPGTQLIVVSDPSAEVVDYFEYFGLIPGIMQPGCCPASTKISCNSGNDVTFISTCSWAINRNIHQTSGIVFSKFNDLVIPLSVGSARIVGNDPNSFTVSEREQNCSVCTSCETFQPSPDNIIAFYETEALVVTFLNSTRSFLPSWFQVNSQRNDRTYSISSHILGLSTTLHSEACSSFPEGKILGSESPTYSILTYEGLARLSINNDDVPLHVSTSPLCISVDLCSGLESPVFLSFPDTLKNDIPVIQNFASQGWKIGIVGMALSRRQNLALGTTDGGKAFQMLLKGGMELTGTFGANMILSYQFSGIAGLEIQAYDDLFEEGLTNVIEVQMKGGLQFILRVSDNIAYRMTGFPEEDVQLVLGGPLQEGNCGLSTLRGKLNDNLFTRETSVLTSFLEIPPNLRHGDRYQFDCDLSYALYTNSTANVNGMILSSSCHYLRIGRLLFTGPVVDQQIKGMSQKLYFGKQSSADCLPETVNDTILPFPVIGIAKSTHNLQLGHFGELPESNSITYGLSTDANSFAAVISDVKMMIFETTFTTDITITSQDGLRLSADVDLFGEYPFHLEISSSSNQEWESISYLVEGSANKNTNKSLIAILEDITLSRIRSIAETATQRVNSARMALDEVRQVTQRLTDEKDRAQEEVGMLSRMFNATVEEIENLENSVQNTRQRLRDLGQEGEKIQTMLDNSCMIQDCNYTCVPGIVPDNCTDIVLEDVPGTCNRTVIEPRVRTVVVAEVVIECERWRRVEVEQQHCGCSLSGFAGCSCSVTHFEEPRCVGSFCRIQQTAEVTEYVAVQRWVECVVDQKMVNRIRPCQTVSQCKDVILDRMCVDENDNCTTVRNNILQEINSTQQEASMVLSDLQQLQQGLSAANLRRDRLQASLDISQSKVDQLTEDCDALTESTQVQDIQFIEEVNRAGLKLAELLKTSSNLFEISSIDFMTTIREESPSVLLLGIGLKYGNGSSRYLTTTFDFDNIAPSLSAAEAKLVKYVSMDLAGTSRRRKRQFENQEGLPPFDRLQQKNAELKSMNTFFKGLSNSLNNLNKIAQNLTSSAKDVEFFLNLNTIVIPTGISQPPPTTSPTENVTDPFTAETEPPTNESSTSSPAVTDSTLDLNIRSPVSKALDNLAKTYASNAKITATIATVNLLPRWQARVNIFLNQTRQLFGQECSGISDCLVSSVDMLNNILGSAPREVVMNTKAKVKEAEKDLQDLSISSNLTLANAATKLDPIVSVIDNAIKTEYWSLLPPNVTRSNKYELSVLENEELKLFCSAVYNFKYPVRYQWRKDGLLLPLANASTLVIESASLEDKGNYTCVVSNHAGATESLWTNVTVLRPPTFYYEPFNATVTVGDANPAVLICNATSVPNPQFKWYFRAKNATNFNRIPDVRGNEYHVEDPQKDDEGWYHCEAWIKYNDSHNISAFSRDAYVSVVDASVTRLAIPIKVTVNHAEQIDENDLNNTIQGITKNVLKNSPPDLRPTLSQVTINMSVNTGQTVISALVNSRNAPLDGIVSKKLPEIAKSVSRCRKELVDVTKILKTKLSSPIELKMGGLQSVRRAADTSDYGYVFECPPGQQLDENTFILCSNCPPGTYETKTKKTMTDDRGLEFTVNQQICSPCELGTYQPNEGSTKCIPCPSGISLVNGAITDEQCLTLFNECLDNNGGCEHDCVDTVDSYHCICHTGYLLAVDSTSCKDIDECAKNTDDCSHGCVNTEGSYNCTCPDGYELSGDNRTCVDIDDCMRDIDGCSHGCVNTEGSYYCTCPDGYELSGDNRTCVDIDECMRDIDGCSNGCNNTEGSYYCTCPDGYELGNDSRTCADIDECMRDTDGCSDGCVNTEGSYYCTCPDGYEHSNDSRTCVDIDECMRDIDGCSHGCVNTEGSYYCTCPDGYELGNDSRICVDIDECMRDTDGCSHGCVNTEGSYYCTCPKGYELRNDSRTCVDIDECMRDIDGCSHGCVNTEGSYYCTCPDGYELSDDSRTCVEIDDCMRDIDGCSHGCVNTEGSYYCTCPDGYELSNDSRTCVDIDECMRDTDGCSHGCINTEGSYYCTCPDGYELSNDSRTCVDIDECMRDTDGCSHGCVNTEGSYYCTCPNGYELSNDSRTCVDIDECARDIDGCSHGCINIEGLYNCTCPDGYELSYDHRTCVGLPVIECGEPSQLPFKDVVNVHFGCDLCVDNSQTVGLARLICQPATNQQHANCTIRNPDGLTAQELEDGDSYVYADNVLAVTGKITNPEDPASPTLLGTWTCTCVNRAGIFTATSKIGQCNCDPRCVRGNCTEDFVCVCPEGWTGDDCNTSMLEVYFSQTMYSANESNPIATVTLKASSVRQSSYNVVVSVRDGTARASKDYSGVNFTVTFEPDEVMKTLEIPIIDDMIAEGLEEMFLEIFIPDSSLDMGVINGDPRTAVLKILDDDCVTVHFDSLIYRVEEGDSTVVVLETDGEFAVPFNITVHLRDGSATAAEDYVGSSSPYTVAFGIGISSASITMETVDNNVVDCSKSFKAALSIPSSRSGLCVVAGDSDVAEIAIVDNEEAVLVSFQPIRYIVSEGNKTAVTLVTSSPGFSFSFTVHLMLKDDTTTKGSDYVPIPASVTFSPGEEEVSFEVITTDNKVAQLSKRFEVVIINATTDCNDDRVEIGSNNTAAIEIVDNDVISVCIDLVTYSVLEGQVANVTVKMNSTAYTFDCEVTLIDVADTASAGDDYTGGPYTVTFSADKSQALVSIPTAGDSAVEGNEAFYVKVLSTCGPQVSVCPTSRGRIVIVDDDNVKLERDYFLAYFKNWRGSTTAVARVIVAYSVGNGEISLKSGTTTPTTYHLSPATPLVIPVPGAVSYLKVYQLTVKSGSAVELFAASFRGASSGAFKVFPAEGTYLSPTSGFYNDVYRYFAVSAPQDLSLVNSVMSIVSVADETEVAIKLTANARIYRIHSIGDMVNITAIKGQPIPIISTNGDLTGTEVMSNKPLAVYSGHECATIPHKKRFCDQIVEQIPPESSLGIKYIAFPFHSRQGGSVVKIVATHSQTKVNMTCSQVETSVILQSSQAHQFVTPPNIACSISTSHPVLVAQLSTGGDGELFGDPSMVILPPIDRFFNSCVVYSFPNDRAMRHFITIIAPMGDEIYVNDSAPPALGSIILNVPMDEGPSYKVVSVKVSSGTHRITSNGDTIGVVAYGSGPSTGYAYSCFVEAMI